jgi:hypothetical protein
VDLWLSKSFFQDENDNHAGLLNRTTTSRMVVVHRTGDSCRSISFQPPAVDVLIQLQIFADSNVTYLTQWKIQGAKFREIVSDGRAQ